MSRRLVVLALAILIAANAWSGGRAGAAVDPSQYEQDLVRLVNAERVRAGRWPLAVSTSLAQAARQHNDDMIARGFFDHTGSDGSTPGQRAAAAGYKPYGWGECFVGENIGGGYNTPADAFAAWMASDGHRANILNPYYREIGAGYAEGGSFGKYWTLDFGSQPKVLPMFVNDGAAQAITTTVSLTLTQETVSDFGSIGRTQDVMIANDASFTGAVWQPYSQSITWRLPSGSGPKGVYARMRDAQGNTVDSSTSVYVVPVDLKFKAFLPLVVRR